MVSENWIEILKSDIIDSCVFFNCIIWNNKEFEKVTWENLLIYKTLDSVNSPGKLVFFFLFFYFFISINVNIFLNLI